MRGLAEADRIRNFMRALGAAATREANAYFTGGASAVLMGWRAATIDVDVTFVPDADELLRALPALKEQLELNVEIASPADFLPELPGWQERSIFIGREGKVTFLHYDFYAQVLAKIERGHAQDRLDVQAMLDAALVIPDALRQLLDDIMPRLYRYPAVDPAALRRAVEETLADRR